jgi:PAS domain S-box-containing protein
MASPLKRRNSSDRWRIVLGAVVGGLLSLLLILAVFFGRGVVDDLKRLQSASSDNVQWMLSQVEVEYHAFVSTLNYRESDGTSDLGAIREKYDVLYSRVDTLHSSPMFQGLAQDPTYLKSLTILRGFVFQVLPLIDSDDESLRAGIGNLWEQTTAIRWDVRALSVSGLSHFARESDLRRSEMAQTLLNLALVSTVLFAALTALSFYLLLANRKSQMRGIMLAQANARMNTVLSTSLDAIIVTKSNGELLEFNRAAEHIFQRQLDDVKGKLVEDIIVPPSLRQAHRDGIQRLNSGVERWILGKDRVQTEGIRADGEVFPMELTLQSASYGTEEILIGFIRDISQRVSDEKELIEARDRALAGEKAKADFLKLMSHEIRTPLNGILGNLSLLDHSDLANEQRRFVRNMKISGDVLLGHVDSVLDIAMLEAGKLAIVNEPMQISALLQDLVAGQSGSANSQNIDIDWKWVGTPRDWIISDVRRLHQLLLNLVGNALKFTDQGQVMIEAEVDRTPVGDISQKHIIEFRVVDTGIGIPENDIDRLFEDFQTSGASSGRMTGGTGLGLGIAKRMAEAMGGNIAVKSVVGEGSTFAVQLPISVVDSPVLDPRSRAQTDNRPGLDILVVEDNEINLEVIQNMLQGDGHNVSFAPNGLLGVKKAQEQRYDFIFMDISMPVMDGIQATSLIRDGDGLSTDAPIIAVSANVMPQDRDRFLEVGMNAYISKPLTLEKLRREISAFRNGHVDKSEHHNVENPIQVHLTDMRANLGEEVFPMLLERMLSESDALVQDLCQSGKRQTALPELPELAAQIHKTAGSAAVFGATDFRQRLLDLEKAAKSEDVETFTALTNQLGEIWSETRAELTFSD